MSRNVYFNKSKDVGQCVYFSRQGEDVWVAGDYVGDTVYYDGHLKGDPVNVVNPDKLPSDLYGEWDMHGR
ncbi:MAG: hypothetical protein HQK96_09815 [Nitrospirae bacterium]|nr:hypothetical protein [Nitrospirota bacterium]